jgi:hypothetical protein
MRVLLSAIALAALLLLVGALSVFAADGALVAEAPVTVDPLQPPPPPDGDTTAPVTDTVTEAAAPAVDLVTDTVDPIVDVAEPVVAPIVEVVDPVLDPVVDVVAPVVAPIVDVVDPVVDPVLDLVEPVVAPIVEVIDPVLDPIVDVIDPITGPVVDVVEPIVDPIVDVVEPVTPPGLGLVDTIDPDAATGPASGAAGVLSWGAAASIAVASSIMHPAWRPIGTDPASADSRAGGVAAETPSVGTPAGVPYPRAPLVPLSDAAGSGSPLSLGAWIALLTAGLLGIVFYAFRRPWSSVPTLRGRSLLPALRPA